MSLSAFRPEGGTTFLPIWILLALINSATGALTWVKPPRSLAVYENTPPGTVVGNLTLQGVGVLNIASQCSHLVIQQKDKTSSSLIVNLVLNTHLDKENPPPGLICNLSGSSDTDTPSPSPLTVQIVILDVNDVTPRLLNQPYSVSVSESERPNTVVFQNISAVDEDTNDRQTYTLTSKASDGKFKINPTNGQITLQSPLDFEDVRFYQYVVTVTDDAGHKASADVFITVLDEQDTPPFFTGEPFQKVIYENENLGTSLLTVRAADGDRVTPNAVIFSIINESCNDVFTINNKTGVITLVNYVDSESEVISSNAGVCFIVVLATEDKTHPQLPGSIYTATTSVTISILDENDNPPLFSQSSYNITVKEDTPRGTPVNLNSPITVSDIDQAVNSIFDVKVTLLGEYFMVNPTRSMFSQDFYLILKDSYILNYDKSPTLKILIVAQDVKETFASTATVTVNVIRGTDSSSSSESNNQLGGTISSSSSESNNQLGGTNSSSSSESNNQLGVTNSSSSSESNNQLGGTNSSSSSEGNNQLGGSGCQLSIQEPTGLATPDMSGNTSVKNLSGEKFSIEKIFLKLLEIELVPKK